MEPPRNLQGIVEEPIVLDYAKVENKKNWKKLAIYGGIVAGALTLGGYAIYRYVDSLDIAGLNFGFVP